MSFSKYFSTIKNHIVATLLMLSAMLVMVTPVLANTSGWSWQGYVDGLYINGKNNGVLHHMTAGNLTNSGSIWSTNWAPYPIQPWRFQVKRSTPWPQPDQTICTTGWIMPSAHVGQSVSFSQGCGSISSGDYYLVAWRSESDERAYSASGTFHTP